MIKTASVGWMADNYSESSRRIFNRGRFRPPDGLTHHWLTNIREALTTFATIPSARSRELIEKAENPTREYHGLSFWATALLGTMTYGITT